MSYATYKDLKKPDEDNRINPTGHWNNPKKLPSNVNDLIDHSQFIKLLKKYPIIVVDAWAAWCAPCKIIAPHFEILATKYKNVKSIIFLTDNIDNEDSEHRNKVSAIPAFFIYYNGKKIKKFVGESIDVLETFINKLIYDKSLN